MLLSQQEEAVVALPEARVLAVVAAAAVLQVVHVLPPAVAAVVVLQVVRVLPSPEAHHQMSALESAVVEPAVEPAVPLSPQALAVPAAHNTPSRPPASASSRRWTPRHPRS